MTANWQERSLNEVTNLNKRIDNQNKTGTFIRSNSLESDDIFPQINKRKKTVLDVKYNQDE